MFRRFLGRFSDNFSQKVEPAVLLVCADAPPSFFEVTTLAGFRDLIAISTVAYNRALELRHPRGHRVMFGEAFAIYPYGARSAVTRDLQMNGTLTAKRAEL